MRHARAVMHVGIDGQRGGENITGIPVHAQPSIFLIWQEAHVVTYFQWQICSSNTLVEINELASVVTMK